MRGVVALRIRAGLEGETKMGGERCVIGLWLQPALRDQDLMRLDACPRRQRRRSCERRGIHVAAEQEIIIRVRRGSRRLLRRRYKGMRNASAQHSQHKKAPKTRAV